jgi:hypothetical protein
MSDIALYCEVPGVELIVWDKTICADCTEFDPPISLSCYSTLEPLK